MDDIRSLYRNSAVYAMGSFVGKAIGFVMIPIYTRCLTPADYGTIELMYRATDVVALLAAMGFGPAVLRIYFDYEAKRERNQVVSSGFLSMLLCVTLLAVVICIFRSHFSMLIFGHGNYGTLVELAAASMLLELLMIVPLSYLQAEQKSVFYTGTAFGKLLIGLAINIWLVVWAKMGVMGVAWSATISALIPVLVILPLVIRRTGLGFSMEKTLEVLKYGVPLVPGQIAMFVLSFTDRFVLNKYGGVDEVGIYSLGYKFGILLSVLITQPFLQAWVPYALSIVDTEPCERTYSNVFKYFSVIAIGFALLISLMARDVVAMLSDPAFVNAYKVIPLICLGQVLRAIAYQLEIGIIVSKRSIFRTLTVGSSAILNIILNFALIPRWGAVGAAWAATLSFGFFAIATHAVSNRLFPVRYDFARVLGSLAMGSGVYGASTLVRLQSHFASATLNAGFWLSFPACLVVSGILPKADIKRTTRSIIERLLATIPRRRKNKCKTTSEN